MGLYLNKKLEFKDHIETVNTKINKFCGTIYQLRKILNKQQLNQFYQTYFKPIVQYGVLAYGSITKSNHGKTDRKINRLTRVLTFNEKVRIRIINAGKK